MKPVVTPLSPPRSHAAAASPVPATGHRTIGAILVDSGRITAADAERILRVQKTNGQRFGQVALELELATIDDIRYALSHQFDYPALGPADTSLSRELIAAYQPFSRTVEQLRALRSQLMLRWFTTEAERKPLAILAPDAGAGASFIAANLAIVFSQLGEKTLLIDANLRTPQQHTLFKIPGGSGLTDLLAGRAGPEAAVRVSSLVGLSVLPAGAIPPNPQELLSRAGFSELLARLAIEYDVVLVDTPPAVEYADAQMIAARAGAAILVARRNVTSVNQMQYVGQQVQQAGALLLGSVLNDGG